MFGARMCARKERKVFFYYRDSEGAFGIESATMRGSFWKRIRWGNVVAAAGVRGQDGRKKGRQSLFSRDSERVFGIESATRGGCARLWAELRRLWARGSGAPNPFFF